MDKQNKKKILKIAFGHYLRFTFFKNEYLILLLLWEKKVNTFFTLCISLDQNNKRIGNFFLFVFFGELNLNQIFFLPIVKCHRVFVSMNFYNFILQLNDNDNDEKSGKNPFQPNEMRAKERNTVLNDDDDKKVKPKIEIEF